MKILYVLNDTFKKGGTESVVFNYFDNINQDAYQIDFMIHTTQEEAATNEMYNFLIDSGVKVYCVVPRRISVEQNRREIKKVLKENHYDIVHSHADAANSIILSIAKKCGVKIRIAHSHNTGIPIKIRNLKSFLHVSYLQLCRYKTRKIANVFLACSKEAGLWLFGKKLYKNGKIKVLSNAIDVDNFKYNKEQRYTVRKKLGYDTECVLGHVGRFSVQKNHLFILQLFAEILKKNDNYRLLLVGDGPDIEEIKNRSRQMEVFEKIKFIGASNEVSKLLQAMDVFVFPSLYEGLGISIIEAQANGLPCVMTESSKVSSDGCVTDLVKRIPLNDIDAWGKYIIDVDKERKNRLDEIKRAGFDIRIEVKKLEAIYDECMNTIGDVV